MPICIHKTRDFPLDVIRPVLHSPFFKSGSCPLSCLSWTACGTNTMTIIFCSLASVEANAHYSKTWEFLRLLDVLDYALLVSTSQLMDISRVCFNESVSLLGTTRIKVNEASNWRLSFFNFTVIEDKGFFSALSRHSHHDLRRNALNGGEWSASHDGWFINRETPSYCLHLQGIFSIESAGIFEMSACIYWTARCHIL